MTQATLEQGGAVPNTEGAASSHWMRRTLLVTFCLLLVGAIALVFTRLTAARVPEQRATLEKLITDRTGLAVRFDNVHFSWNLNGTSAVFTRVVLTDPKAGRVRVVAPELRVEFDTWDFLRHQQFSLGHVTLRSPDIEIIGDELRDEPPRPASAGAKRKGQKTSQSPGEDERALVRRFTKWVELMPNGRIEVEGARVHLVHRGESAARHTFTLSQAVVSRGTSNFNAYGTLLLAQDVGQSLFVSAKLEGLAANAATSGDLRLIARRVFLEKLRLPGLAGRGTIDARLHLNAGRVESATWQASARELEMNGGQGQQAVRFDHVALTGTIERDAHDVLLSFKDLQFTRGARLERAPQISARVVFEPRSLRIARTTAQGDRVPFMAAEFIAGLLAPQLANGMPALPGGWAPTAGELRALHFDSGARHEARDTWAFSADLAGTEITRVADHARLADIAAKLRLDAQGLTVTFDPTHPSVLRASPAAEPRTINAGGTLAYLNDAQAPRWRFEEFSLASEASTVRVHGEWDSRTARPRPLTLEVAHLERAVLLDAWTFLNGGTELPPLLAGVERGNLIQGALQLLPEQTAEGDSRVNWRRSSGEFTLADIALTGDDLPRIDGVAGTLKFARGNATLRVDDGRLDELAITAARIDWPRGGVARMHASLAGDLSSPVLRRVLQAQGLERLRGKVTLEADARGEREMRSADSWRVTARVSEASVPLAVGVPPIEKLSGTLRFGDRQLRALALEGSWLGGPIEIEARRANPRAVANSGSASSGMASLAMNGSADAVQLLRLLGKGDFANRVSGQLAWNGVAQRAAPPNSTNNASNDAQVDAWQISLASNLAGVESRLPAPLAKARARQVPLNAELRIEGSAIRNFEIGSGRELVVRGQVGAEATVARFELAGLTGELRRPVANGSTPRISIDRLTLERAPGLLAMSSAVLPSTGGLTLAIGDLRHGDQSLGALDAEIARHDGAVEFSFESRAQSPHQISVQGTCANTPGGRCDAEFTVVTSQLAGLLKSGPMKNGRLPTEWPTESLRAAGRISWPGEVHGELARALSGQFELETRGADPGHQLFASATLDDGDIRLANVQGSGPAADQVFRGGGRVGLVAHDYDLTFDFEQVSLAASAAVPTPARARLSRAWNALRGSVARRGWAELPETRRVQWHGYWAPGAAGD
jgi:hypothetical protein